MNMRQLENALFTVFWDRSFSIEKDNQGQIVIYTGLEESIERLWGTMYFDWEEMWRRYGWYE